MGKNIVISLNKYGPNFFEVALLYNFLVICLCMINCYSLWKFFIQVPAPRTKKPIADNN